MFDLSKFGTKEDLTKGAWLEFENKAGDPVFRIKLTSTDGETGEKLIFERIDKRTRKGVQLSPPTTKQTVEQNVRLLARLTLEWESLDEKTGQWNPIAVVGEEQLSCTFNNAVYLYTKIPTIQARVNSFVNDPENFVPEHVSVQERGIEAINRTLEAIEGNSQSGPSGASATQA